MAHLSIRHKTTNYFPIGHNGSVELNHTSLKHSANRNPLTGVRTRSACILVQFLSGQVHWIFELAKKIWQEVVIWQKFISIGGLAEGYVCSAIKSAVYHFLSHHSPKSVQPAVFFQKMSNTNGQLSSASFEVSKLKAWHYFSPELSSYATNAEMNYWSDSNMATWKVTKMGKFVTTEIMD